MGEVFYSTKWVKYSTLPWATTENTTTTHNNQHEPPPPYPFSGFGPLSPWQHPTWTQILVPLLPMGPLMVRCVGCTLAALLSFVWGTKMQPIKNREREGVSAFGGHLLVGQHNNQPKFGVRGRRDIGEGAQPGQKCVWDKCHTIVWGTKLSNNKNKNKNMLWP